MKKILVVIAVLLIVCSSLLFSGHGSEEENGTAKDYETIRTVKSEMALIVKSSAIKSIRSVTSMNIYELGLMYQKDDAFFKRLRSDLGEDFPWKLSNGDSLFVGVYPLKRTYSIYAGKPDIDHMIYPTWNYEAVPDLTAVSDEDVAE